MTIIKKTVATGKVIPRREIEVKSQVSGVVDKLYVTAGQTVKKGAIIARISLRPNMLNVSSAEAQVAAARISLRNQAADLERYKKLLETKVISESQFDHVRHQLRPAEAGGGLGARTRCCCSRPARPGIRPMYRT